MEFASSPWKLYCNPFLIATGLPGIIWTTFERRKTARETTLRSDAEKPRNLVVAGLRHGGGKRIRTFTILSLS
jgi:hypothetical protein